MRHFLLTAIALVALGCCGEDTPASIDALNHKAITLPDGTTVEVYELGGSAYKRIAVSALEQSALSDDGLCFEAKFHARSADGRLAIEGTTVGLTSSDPNVVRTIKALTNGDNISCFGTLRKTDDRKNVEFVLSKVFKEAGDLQRFQNALAALKNRSARGDLKADEQTALAENFIDLGKRAAAAAKQPFLVGNDSFALASVATAAFTDGLSLKERAIKAMRPNDAESYFGLALEYHELLQANVSKYRELVLKTLSLDPDHAGAVRIAAQFGYQKFEGRWLTAEQIETRVHDRDTDQARLNQILAGRAQALQQRIAAEGSLLSTHLTTELSSGDRARSAAALDFYREIVDGAPEVGTPLLTPIAEIDGATALAAMSAASHSRSPQLRGLGYEALAWRANRSQEREAALSILCDAMKSEHESASARTGVEALVALGGKPAVGALVCSLSANESSVREEIIVGLKTMTRQSLNNKEAWESWWAKNK